MAGVEECEKLTEDEQKAHDEAAQTAYGGVNVLILGNKDGTITFNAVGDKEGVEHTAEWGNEEVMWCACPSTLPSAAKLGDPGPVPEIEAQGILYLSEKYLSETPDLRPVVSKWPLRLPAEATNVMRIWPTRVVVTGVGFKDGGMYDLATVDLLDPAECLPRTDDVVPLDGSAFEVPLTQTGVQRFNATFSYTHVLPQAIATIAAAEPDPARMAKAWSVIDGALRNVRAWSADRRAGRDVGARVSAEMETDLALLRQALPHLEL